MHVPTAEDVLTQLPNRILFLDRVEHALTLQRRHRDGLAVMLIDLDDFKMVNDTSGHAINVAPRQLGDPAFVSLVTDALAHHLLPPDRLTLEITERTLTAHEPQIELAMARLKRIGVGLAIDDFGTGYAALGNLRRFPVTTLKIDRPFVNGVDESKDRRSLVKTIIRLGEAFELAVVAEGIETASQRDDLMASGCDLGQGFLYAPGLAAAEAGSCVMDQPSLHLDKNYLALTPYAGGIAST